MELVFTAQFFESLDKLFEFLAPQISYKRLSKIHESIMNAPRNLLTNPYLGQIEPHLTHLNLEHRRLVVKHCKIIYRICNNLIYITEVFDTRQDPNKMKG